MEFKLEEYAKNIVKNMRIGQKPNPNIPRARKKYGQFIDKLFSRKHHLIADLSSEELLIIRKLKSINYGPMAYQKAARLIPKPLIGEAVRISYIEQEECIKLAKAVRTECWKKGAHVLMQPVSDKDTKEHFKIAKETSLVEPPSISQAIARTVDATIFIGYDQDPEWSLGLEKRILLASNASMKLHEIIDKRNVRWCIAGYPVKMKQHSYHIPRAQYEKIFFEAITETFTPKVKQLCHYYQKSLQGKENIRIIAKDGTDLSFSIKNRPILVSDGRISSKDIENCLLPPVLSRVRSTPCSLSSFKIAIAFRLPMPTLITHSRPADIWPVCCSKRY